jgi:hypothetical protein
MTFDKDIERPKKVYGWAFYTTDAIYGLVGESLTVLEDKIKPDILAAFKTFKAFPRTGGLPGGEHTGEDVVVKDPDKGANLDHDSCRDIAAGTTVQNDMVAHVVVPCTDTDGNGQLDVPSCLSWDNQSRDNCSGPSQAVAGTPAKCRCEQVNVAEIPIVESPGTRVRVIAGEHAGARGAARTFSRVTLLDATVNAGARLLLDGPAGDNLGVLVISGGVRIGGRSAAKGELVLFGNDGELAELEATADAHVLVVGGEPIREPIAAYGPFVMNTAEEIGQAFDDLRAGKLGQLED